MESKRQQQYARLIQKELGEILQKESRSLIGNNMVTVTRVMMSPDLSIAKVYLSFLLDNSQELFDRISNANKSMRRNLGNRIGKSVRIIPELIFIKDESSAYAQHIDQVISGLDIPEAPDGDEEE